MSACFESLTKMNPFEFVFGNRPTELSLYFEPSDQLFPGAVACLLMVVAGFSLLLVFMSYDFGLPLLWTIGVLSGLASARTGERS